MFSEHVQSRTDQRELTRDKVLASAERLFRSQGFDATTIRQIAAEAGVSTGTVMAAGDKDALLIAIFDGWISAVHRDRSPAPADGPVVDQVVALVEPFVDYFARDRDLSRRYAAVIVRGTHETDIFRDLGLALVGEIADTLTRNGISTDRAGRAASAVYFGYLGTLMAASNGSVDDETARHLFRDLVDLIVDDTTNQERS